MTTAVWALLVLVPPQEAAPGDLEGRVRDLVLQLDADTVEVRDRAVRDLGGLGHAALPLLRARLPGAEVEAQARIEEAIELIHHRDPIFLVRPPARRVTGALREISMDEAIRSLFHRFPDSPTIDRSLQDAAKPKVTLALTRATYWEAIAALETATGTTCGVTQFQRPPEWERTWTSRPAGFCRFAARTSDAGETVRVQVAMVGEPGLRPIYVGFDPGGVELAPGRIVRDGIVPRREWIGSEFCPSSSGIAWVELAELTLRKSDLKEDAPLKFRGTARVTLATRVEAQEYFLDASRGPDERRIGDCRIVLETFRRQRRGVDARFESESPDGWAPPADRPWLSHAWKLLDDGQGHALDHGCLRLAGRVSSGLSGQEWPFEGKPVRLTLVRPLEVERIDVPLEIDFIPLRSK